MHFYRKYLMVCIFIFISTSLSVIDAYSETKPNKAIIVAGDGLFYLNDETEFIANKAYKTLLHLNYTKDQIYYLGQDLYVDSDGNGEYDDIDSLATLGHLNYAISTWSQDAHNLVLFLVGHGGHESFLIREGEILIASELDKHMDALQNSPFAGNVIFIYDAANSGSFIPALIPPTDKERILVTSCAENGSTWFRYDARYSFSYIFWTLLWESDDILKAFDHAGRLVSDSWNQNPQLDTDGNGIPNEKTDVIPSRGIGQEFQINTEIASSVDNSNLDWFTSDDSEWFIQTEYSFFNGSSVQSPILNHSRKASINTNILGKGTLEFHWKVSSEQTGDFLSFYINDSEKSKISGEMDWQHQSYNLPAGEHRIKWTYEKDKGVSQGIDAGWLDKVEFRYDTIQNPSKAIVVEAGYVDSLSDVVKRLSSFAYKVLLSKGFRKENIFFLGPDTAADVDGNGLSDDVDAFVSLENLYYATNYWAKESLTSNLILYMVGYGSPGQISLNANEMLYGTDLDTWLDEFQQTGESRVLLISDSGSSGSFIPLLTPPAGKERIIITSSKADEAPYFLNQGILSFSFFFWSNVLDTSDIGDSFDYAERVMQHYQNQTALLDADGNGVPDENTYLINNFSIEQLSKPSLSLNQAIDSMDLKYLTGGSNSWFKQSSNYFYNGSAAQSGAIEDNQNSFLETKINGPGALKFNWKVSSEQDFDFLQFFINGIMQTQISGEINWQQQVYNIPVGTHTLRWNYYKDKSLANGSDAGWLDKLEFIPDQITLPDKAIIVAGQGPIPDNLIWEETQLCTQKAYRTLIYNHFDKDSVYYLDPTGSLDIDGDGKNDIDAEPTIQNLSNIIYHEIYETETNGIVIYLVGHGGYNNVENMGNFILSEHEILPVSTLNLWLNDLPDMDGPVILIVDACGSGSFFNDINYSGSNTVIVITSAGELEGPIPGEVNYETAKFLNGGQLSFSYQFWSALDDGAEILQAFIRASTMMEVYQHARMDGNGNGVPNEKNEQAKNIYIVKGTATAPTRPLINNVGVFPDIPLVGENSATLWAEITSVNPPERVWAVIVSPDESVVYGNTPVTYYTEVDLEDSDGDNTYSGTYSYFSIKGIYKIAIYASNEEGYYSLPGQISVEQTVQPSCLGDYDGDGDVDGKDLADLEINSLYISLSYFAAGFGKYGCRQPSCPGDYDGDDDLDGKDLAGYEFNSLDLSLSDFAAVFGKSDCRK